jgi:hypothetical protein
MTKPTYRRVNVTLDGATIAKSKALGQQWGQSFSSLVRYLVKNAFEDALKALGDGNNLNDL